jgi:hypothetical protein
MQSLRQEKEIFPPSRNKWLNFVKIQSLSHLFLDKGVQHKTVTGRTSRWSLALEVGTFESFLSFGLLNLKRRHCLCTKSFSTGCTID